MNTEADKNLIHKYIEGESTLDEEMHLFTKSDVDHPGIEAWSRYVESTKISVPENLSNVLWDEQAFKTNKPHNKWTYLIVATIICLAALLFINMTNEKKQNHEIKRALLAEAITMTKPSPQKHILYEDEIVIISYTKN